MPLTSAATRLITLGSVHSLDRARTEEDRQVILRTERLILTSWLPSDVTALALMHSDSEGMRYVRSRRPESLTEVVDLVKQYRGEHRDRGWTKWRLARHDGELVGRAGFGGADTRRGLS